jgi:hypothetical protein
LRTLAGARRRPDYSCPLFSGWRGTLVGDVLRDVFPAAEVWAGTRKKAVSFCRWKTARKAARPDIFIAS